MRQICKDAGLTEKVKWGHPCYMRGDRNIALFGAFRSDFRLDFMNAALLSDPHQMLVKAGPNSQNPSMMTFTDSRQIEEMKPIIFACLQEAIAFADAGVKAPKVVRDIDLPDELVDALDADPELSEAFHNLTPGRKKSYAFALYAAKMSATRIRRIATFRGHILEGKGALER